MMVSDQEQRPTPMDKRPFQYSLYSLLVLTTACAVLMSLVKTFPNASILVAAFGLLLAGPLLFFLGTILVFHPQLFFHHRTRYVRVYAPLAGLLCIAVGLVLIALFSS